MDQILTPNRYLLITVILFASLLTACDKNPGLVDIRDQGSITVITRNGPTTYYENKDGATGFEYELAKLFADYLGVELNIVVVHTLDDVFKALDKNQVHLAAAGLTITPERRQRFEFSPPYMDVQQHLIYHKGNRKPGSVEDILNSRIMVMANSSHAEILGQLQLEKPALEWRTATDVETIDLLDMLMDDELDYTVIDSNDYIANRGFYLKLKIGFDLGKPGKLAWALPGNTDNTNLRKELVSFFKEIEDNGKLHQLKERFYSHSNQINQIGSRTFTTAVENKLPEFQPLMEKVAREYNMDWRLLASISYQESHWNPAAKSPTGVRGMMMLTRPTAKEMGVKNRLNIEQSLRGGARYFNKIAQRVPERIPEPDRTWFALAAYNVGMGHVEDARIITQQQGGDPDKWADVKNHLPLLRKHRWYRNTKHGYARGDEPVTYVQNIRHFYNLLTWTDVTKNRKPPPKKVDQYLPDMLKNDFYPL